MPGSLIRHSPATATDCATTSRQRSSCAASMASGCARRTPVNDSAYGSMRTHSTGRPRPPPACAEEEPSVSQPWPFHFSRNLQPWTRMWVQGPMSRVRVHWRHMDAGTTTIQTLALSRREVIWTV
jgi:hypothetical protein